MASAFDDEELAITIPSSNRRGSNRPAESGESHAQQHPQWPRAERPHSSVTQRLEQRLGQYRIVRTLGEGSFGKVKLAVHKVSGQEVALKIINRKKLVTRDMAGRIEREIQYLQLLRHPHIIKLYTVVPTKDEIIMVLEYAGSELFDYIVQHGRMNEDKARKFFQQIVCAVEYCHRHKIVHRDLKPENLLLDQHLHVKIADFGLSNIMTDGNFLKTSCGSPNYAAPEVISGKLYAGPEVDVWSCGVILYVLLVGRLPFDDEYIPALFKKIAQGNYVVPSYLSQGAVRLIKKMLVVNPVNRITIQEIRQDPWFMKDLPEYLQPPVEEFFDTGVDPNKSIDPRNLAPKAPAIVQEKLHNSVIGKLGKTMGYGKEDVQEALSKDEPSAIKDAYLIVRENQIMATNPLIAKEAHLFAQSPPTFAQDMPGSPAAIAANDTRNRQPLVGTSAIPDRAHRQSSVSSGSILDTRSPANTVAVLNSSMPDYHKAFMQGQPRTGSAQDIISPQEEQRHQTTDEQAATVRRLKPHNRSQVNLEKASRKPDTMTPLAAEQPKKKHRPTKWQFGIRSRNTPHEILLVLYKALKRMDAEWEIPALKRTGRSHSGSEDESSSDDNVFQDELELSPDEGKRHGRSPVQRSSSGRDRGRQHYGPHNSWGYELPEDPWVVNARIRKEDMFPPGVTHPGSTHSSRVDLTGVEPRRRGSVMSSATAQSTGSNGDDSAQQPLEPQTSAERPTAEEAVWVYVTLQLYTLESNFFVVDFKCAGYEQLVRKFVGEVKRHGTDIDEDISPTASNFAHQFKEHRSHDDDEDRHRDEGQVIWEGQGRATEEKEVSSPYPFIDVAATFITALADND